jgi:hypothetical protein
MKARDRDVHGALDAFLATGGLANRDQRPLFATGPVHRRLSQGLRGSRTHGTVTVEWFSSSKILMLVRAVP